MALPVWTINLLRTPRIQHCGKDLRGVNSAPDACWTENHFSIHWVLLFFYHPVEVVIDDLWLEVPSNTAVVVPPHSFLTLRFLGRSVHHWFHFSCASGRGGEVPIPVLAQLSRSPDRMRRSLQAILREFQSSPATAGELLGVTLQEISLRDEKLQVPGRELHPALQKALQSIEQRLHRPLYAPEVAREAKISQRQLLNLLQEMTGNSIVGFIRQRRAERARFLIVHTQRPIQSIAAEVGIPDLQLFNKTIRDFYTKSPRQLRAESKLG